MSDAAAIPALKVDRLGIRFGGNVALDDVSLELAPGRIAGLIGPNGSGKTTLFNCVCGYYRPNSGRVTIAGTDMTGKPTHRIARAGVGRTFQTANLFGEISLRENLRLASDSIAFKGSMLRGLTVMQAHETEEFVEDLLRRLGLAAYADAMPGELPVGIAKLGDLGRAIATRPSLLLLDEPAVGLNDGERHRLTELLVELGRQLDLAMLVVDHSFSFVSALSERITVLAAGRVIASGSPEDIRRDAAVIEAYLGQDADAVP